MNAVAGDKLLPYQKLKHIKPQVHAELARRGGQAPFDYAQDKPPGSAHKKTSPNLDTGDEQKTWT